MREQLSQAQFELAGMKEVRSTLLQFQNFNIFPQVYFERCFTTPFHFFSLQFKKTHQNLWGRFQRNVFRLTEHPSFSHHPLGTFSLCSIDEHSQRFHFRIFCLAIKKSHVYGCKMPSGYKNNLQYTRIIGVHFWPVFVCVFSCQPKRRRTSQKRILSTTWVEN